MAFFNANDAGEQRSGLYEPIPDGTIAPVQLKIRPGKAGDGGWFKASSRGDALMLDMEFTVTDGPYARKKFWATQIMPGMGNGSKGHQTAEDITKRMLRAMWESAHGIDPADNSDEAQSRRVIKSIEDLDGIRFVAKIGLEKGTPYTDRSGVERMGQDRNVLREAVTPDHQDWRQLDQVKSSSPAGAVRPSPAAAAGDDTPEWMK